jgi:pantetheine-phosphate adenylyltransferase
MRYQQGLFTLSGDPVHNGHIQIIQRAAASCTSLLVYLTNSSVKRYLFNLDARRRFLKNAIGTQFNNVDLLIGEDLITDVFLDHGCDVLFRGIRNSTDEEFEKTQLEQHNFILPGIKERTVLLQTHPKLQHISSSAIKAMAAQHVNVAPMVTPMVKVALDYVLHGQHLFGVLGDATQINFPHKRALPICTLHADFPHTHKIIRIAEILQQVLSGESKGSQQLREELNILCREDISTDLQKLTSIFNAAPPQIKESIQALLIPHVDRVIRSTLHKIHLEKPVGFFIEFQPILENYLFSYVGQRVILTPGLNYPAEWNTAVECYGKLFPNIHANDLTTQILTLAPSSTQRNFNHVGDLDAQDLIIRTPGKTV